MHKQSPMLVAKILATNFGFVPNYLLATDHLVTVVLLGQHTQGGLDDATTQTQHQMEGGLWNTTQIGGLNDKRKMINRKTSSISRTKFQNLNVSCILLQLSSLNPLKPGVKLRMKM